jgi:polar amino acid transport system substrate-binding protein
MESGMMSFLLKRLLACLFFIGVAHAQNAHEKELHFVTEPFVPFSYEENGKIVGAMSDAVRAVCERMKAACIIEIFPWRRSMAMAENGNADGIFSLLRTPERERLFFFPDPIAKSAYSFFALESNAFIYRQPNDLDHHTVGVYGPSGTSTTLGEATKASTSSRTEIEINNTVLLKKLAAGRYGRDGIILINRDVGLSLIKQEGIKGLKEVGNLKEFSYTIGLSKTRVTEGQFTAFNAALRALVKEGKIKTILDGYGVSAPN